MLLFSYLQNKTIKDFSVMVGGGRLETSWLFDRLMKDEDETMDSVGMGQKQVVSVEQLTGSGWRHLDLFTEYFNIIILTLVQGLQRGQGEGGNFGQCCPNATKLETRKLTKSLLSRHAFCRYSWDAMQIHYKNREQEHTFTFLTTFAELTARF